MSDHRCADNAETPKRADDLGTLWTPPEKVKKETTVIDGEQVPIFNLLESATGEGSDANDPAMEQPAGDGESGAPDTDDAVVADDQPAELSNLLHPTVEYGGPRLDAAPELNYEALPEESSGPRPTLPPDSPYYEPSYFDMDEEESLLEQALNEETVMESDEDDTPTTTPNFNLSETVVLNENERKQVVLDRLKEIETALIQKQLRKFEIEIMEAINSDEYAEVTTEIGTFLTLQISYVQAFQNL